MKKISQYGYRFLLTLGVFIIVFGAFGLPFALAALPEDQLETDTATGFEAYGYSERFSTGFSGTVKTIKTSVKSFYYTDRQAFVYLTVGTDQFYSYTSSDCSVTASTTVNTSTFTTVLQDFSYYKKLGDATCYTGGVPVTADQPLRIDMYSDGVAIAVEGTATDVYPSYECVMNNGSGSCGIGELYYQFNEDLPVVNLDGPVSGATYGTPVLFQGEITQAYAYYIYYGNSSTTDTSSDTLLYSQDQTQSSNRSFSVFNHFLVPYGSTYFKVAAFGTGGVLVEVIPVTISSSLAPTTFFTSSSTAFSLASTTAASFFNGLGDVMDEKCDFDFFSVFSTATWKTCAKGTFDFMTDWASTRFINLATSAFSKWPWGYGYRVYTILTSDVATSTRPTLAFTIPSDIGLPAAAAGKSFAFDPISSYASATDMISDHSYGSSDMYSTFLFWWDFFCYLAFCFWLLHKVNVFNHQ